MRIDFPAPVDEVSEASPGKEGNRLSLSLTNGPDDSLWGKVLVRSLQR